MQVNNSVPENVVRNLESAIERLNDDFERAEFWAAALNGFLQPVPHYEAPDSEFLLRRREGAETAGKRRSADS